MTVQCVGEPQSHYKDRVVDDILLVEEVCKKYNSNCPDYRSAQFSTLLTNYINSNYKFKILQIMLNSEPS